MIKPILRNSLGLFVLLLASPVAFASSLQYGSANKVGPGHHSFSKAHGFWEGSFADRWKFSLAEDSKIGLAVKDWEWSIGHFKILDIDRLRVVSNFDGGDRERLRAGNWYHTMLAAGDYHFVVKGDVAGLGGKYHGHLKVSAVPLPAAAWLFLSALAGLLVIRRRQQPQLTSA